MFIDKLPPCTGRKCPVCWFGVGNMVFGFLVGVLVGFIFAVRYLAG